MQIINRTVIIASLSVSEAKTILEDYLLEKLKSLNHIPSNQTGIKSFSISKESFYADSHVGEDGAVFSITLEKEKT